LRGQEQNGNPNSLKYTLSLAKTPRRLKPIHVTCDTTSSYVIDFKCAVILARDRPNPSSCFKLPPRSPNLNAYAERFVRTIKESCLEQMIFFDENALRNMIREFLTHYHLERNHQGLENRLLTVSKNVAAAAGPVRKRERIGGLLNYYYREAA
jgi:putative transposase